MARRQLATICHPAHVAIGRCGFCFLQMHRSVESSCGGRSYQLRVYPMLVVVYQGTVTILLNIS